MKYDANGDCYVANSFAELAGWDITWTEEHKPGVQRLFVERMVDGRREARTVFVPEAVITLGSIEIQGRPMDEALGALQLAKPGAQVRVTGGATDGTWVKVDERGNPEALAGAWCNRHTGAMRHFSFLPGRAKGILVERWVD